MYSPISLNASGKHHDTRRGQAQKASHRPIVSLLNLTIVPRRQSADKLRADLLRPLEVEAAPRIVNAHLSADEQSAASVCRR